MKEKIKNFVANAIQSDMDVIVFIGFALQYLGVTTTPENVAESIANHIEGAGMDTKRMFMNLFDDTPFRLCDHCGKFFEQGYILVTEYACSDECAVALYGGNEEALRADLAEEGDEIYYSDWSEW